MNLPAHAVRHEHVVNGVDRDAAQSARHFWTAAAPNQEQE
jgi:hypothetical protein